MIAKEIIFSLHQRGIVIRKEGEELVLTGKTDTLNQQDIVLLKENKVQLLTLLGGQKKPEPEFSSKITEENYQAPVSNLQRNIYFLESLSVGKRYYNVPTAFRLSGKVDEQALAQAVASLCEQFHILRTVYQYRGDELKQCVEPFDGQKVPFEVVTVEDDALAQRLKQEADYSFDLAQQWPIKAVLLKSSKAQYLSLNLHHIAIDGYSAKLITKTLSEAYQRHLGGAAGDQNKEVAPQYADYALWHQEYLQSEACQQARSHWQSLLKDAPSCHRFPLEYARPSTLSVEGDVLYHNIDGTRFEKIKRAAQAKNISVFLLLQSMFAGFMARYGDEEDLVIGSVYANRVPSAFINTIGMFANTIPFRYRFDDNTDINHLIDSSSTQHQKALRYQSFPFEMMLEGLNIERDVSYNPLIQVAFVLQEDSLNEFSLAGVDVEMVNNRQMVSKFDFAAHIYVNHSDVTLQWEFNTNLFSKARTQAIIEQYLDFVDYHLDNEFDPVLLYRFDQKIDINQITTADFDDYISNPELIQKYAQSQPQAIAVREGEHSLTYAELVEQGDRFIAGLQQNGVVSGERVAVYMEKSIKQVIAMYAVMRAGFVYVPLDPAYPQERLAYMCENALIKAMVFLEGFKPEFDLPEQAVMAEFDGLLNAKNDAQLQTLTEEHPAYIIYTSGSTGKPKGVVVPHGSIYFSLQANKKVYDFKPVDMMPTVGSQAFGVSLLETFVPLISGGTVQTMTKPEVADISKLIDTTQDVTVMHMVPSLMAQWLDQIETDSSAYANLRLLLVGAEPVPPILLARLKAWRPDVKVRVLYGMTESSVVSSSYLSDEHDGNGYSIGKAHPNMRFYPMNRYGVPQPVGVPGELYVGGLSLALGYVGLEALTNEKFISHKPLGERLYKTGDRARLLASGHFEYLGRVDHQVSLRGIRIETGEIESLINQIDDVKKCIAHVIELDNGERIFALYYTQYGKLCKDDLESQIKAAFVKDIPESMRPSVLVQIDEFPHNPNGKVDRKKLPKPSGGGQYIAPSTEHENYLHDLWCSMLALEQISIKDNFFELGGHSLMATKLINQINEDYEIQLPLRLFYEASSIHDCAKVIGLEVALRDLSRLLMNNQRNEINGEIDEYVI